MAERIFETKELLYEAETLALVARFSTPPTAGRKYLINETILQLKHFDIWDKLDCLWITAAADSQAARLNWKSTDNTLSAVNSPTFTADRGYQGNGSSSYLNTNYNPSTGTTYTLNNASYGVYSRTNSAIASIVEIGCSQTGVAISRVDVQNASNNISSAINSLVVITNTVTNSLGLVSVNRNSSTDYFHAKNGISFPTQASVSTAIPNVPFYLCASNTDGSPSLFSSRQIAMAFAGSGNIDQLNFYYIIQNYMNQIGANV